MNITRKYRLLKTAGLPRALKTIAQGFLRQNPQRSLYGPRSTALVNKLEGLAHHPRLTPPALARGTGRWHRIKGGRRADTAGHMAIGRPEQVRKLQAYIAGRRAAELPPNHHRQQLIEYGRRWGRGHPRSERGQSAIRLARHRAQRGVKKVRGAKSEQVNPVVDAFHQRWDPEGEPAGRWRARNDMRRLRGGDARPKRNIFRIPHGGFNTPGYIMQKMENRARYYVPQNANKQLERVRGVAYDSSLSPKKRIKVLKKIKQLNRPETFAQKLNRNGVMVPDISEPSRMTGGVDLHDATRRYMKDMVRRLRLQVKGPQ